MCHDQPVILQWKKMANVISAFPTCTSTKIEYDRKNVLGEGNSVVYQGDFEGKKVAVKRIVLNPSISTGDGENGEVQKKFKHENVMKILAIESDLDFRYVVMELCSGTLFGVIEKTYNGPAALPSDREVIYQIADGLAYIHSQNLAHRDIKPENILISKNGKIKLSDFGFISQQTEGKCYVTGLKGTLPWMAPELFQADRQDVEIEIAQKSDVFSCGCVFFVFLTRENGGIHPFGDIVDHLQIYANIQKGNSINIHKNVNHLLENVLIQKMIRYDPIKRVTIKDVINKLEDMLLKGNSAIQIKSVSNQDEIAFPSPLNLTVDYGKPGAKSIYKRYLKDRDSESSRCDGHSVSTLFSSVHGMISLNEQQSTTQQRSYPTPEKQPRYNLRCNTNRILNNNKNPVDGHPRLNSASQTRAQAEVTVIPVDRKRRESAWKLNYFDSQKRSCDSNNNRRKPKEKLFAIKQYGSLNISEGDLVLNIFENMFCLLLLNLVEPQVRITVGPGPRDRKKAEPHFLTT